MYQSRESDPACDLQASSQPSFRESALMDPLEQEVVALANKLNLVEIAGHIVKLPVVMRV